MSRYIKEDRCIKDDEWLDLPSTDAMKTAVSRVILDLARDELDNESHATLHVVVRDDSDVRIFTATLDYSTTWH